MISAIVLIPAAAAFFVGLLVTNAYPEENGGRAFGTAIMVAAFMLALARGVSPLMP